MTLYTYGLYVAAVAVLVLTPGPTMLMCLSQALNHGPRLALTSVAGAVSAALGIMALSALGLGALLAASQWAFNLAKLVGAAYLVWLGIKTYRSQSSALGNLALAGGTALSTSRSFYLRGFMVGASNPKAILFFAAFFPQFLNPHAPMLPQFALLAVSFVAMEFCVLTTGALCVERMAPWLRSGTVLGRINKVCGTVFALFGGLLLLSRRHV